MSEKKNIKQVIFLVTVMLTTIIVMADLPVYVIVNNLYTEFTDQVGTVNFIVSGTALTVMLSSLICAGIMQKIGKKNTLLAADCVFLLCGLGCVFVQDAMIIAVLRGICGVAMGCTNVAAVAILTAYYEDDVKRAKIIGIYNTCMPLIGSVLSAVAGVLAVNGWHNIFQIHWVALPMMVLMLFFIPADQKEEMQQEGKKEKHALGLPFWYMTVYFFLICLGAMMLQMFYSVYIVEHDLGDITFTGLVNTVIGYGSVLANLVFGFVYAKLGRKLVPFSLILAIAGGLLLLLVPGKVTVFVGYFILLAGYGFSFSCAYAYSPMLCSTGGMNMAIGIATATYSLATFLSTYAVTGLQSLFHIETFTQVIPIVVGGLAVLLVLELLLPKRMKKNPYEKEEEAVA